jgi:hypothetical protein
MTLGLALPVGSSPALGQEAHAIVALQLGSDFYGTECSMKVWQMGKSGAEHLSNSSGKSRHCGESPIHRSFQKLDFEFLPGVNLAPSLKASLMHWMLCQKGEHTGGDEEDSSCTRYLALSKRTQSNSPFLSSNRCQIHFAMRALFISLVFRTPRPPWSLGLQNSAHLTRWYFFLAPYPS